MKMKVRSKEKKSKKKPGEIGPQIMTTEMKAIKFRIASRSPQLIDPSRNVVTPQQHRLTSQQPIESFKDIQTFLTKCWL